MTLTQDILKKMLELPNRAAGSGNEQKAAEYLKNVYSYFGVQTKEVDSFTLRNSLPNHLIISFSLIIITILVNFLNITLLTLPIFIITLLVYFRAFNLPFRFFKKRTISKNIYAEIPAKTNEKYTLVVTSHYDSSNDYGSIFSILGPIYNYLNNNKNTNTPLNVPDYINNPLIVSNIAIGITFLALFLPDNYAKFFFGILAGVPLLIGIYLLQRGKSRLPIGAYDNGVGASLLVELAAKLKKEPLENTKVIFANVAAAETLTPGTLTFLDSLLLDKTKTFILDINCIGEEEVVLATSEPSYPLGLHTYFDASMEVISEFAENYYKDKFRTINSPLPSENQNLVLAGYRVMGMLATLPKTGLPANFHSTKDTAEKIKWDEVEAFRDFMVAYLTYFDTLTKEINI